MNLATTTRAVIPRPNFGSFDIGCDLHINNTNKTLNIFAWWVFPPKVWWQDLLNCCGCVGLFQQLRKVRRRFFTCSSLLIIPQVYYFVLIISRFLVCAREIGRDTNSRFGHIFKMRKIVPTLYRLLRDGTIYFVVWVFQSLSCALDSDSEFYGLSIVL